MCMVCWLNGEPVTVRHHEDTWWQWVARHGLFSNMPTHEAVLVGFLVPQRRVLLSVRRPAVSNHPLNSELTRVRRASSRRMPAATEPWCPQFPHNFFHVLREAVIGTDPLVYAADAPHHGGVLSAAKSLANLLQAVDRQPPGQIHRHAADANHALLTAMANEHLGGDAVMPRRRPNQAGDGS